jgi:DNA-binding transcriptional regulator LsrR (DeoR family)
MKFDEYQEKLGQIKKLIEYSNTGSPKDLAKKLNISERTVRRLIERLRLQDSSIVFCRRSNSYILKDRAL